MMRVAVSTIVGVALLTGCSDVRQFPTEPTQTTSAPPTFESWFYNHLIYNAHDEPGDLSGRVSMVLSTTSPNVYIRTTNLSTFKLAALHQEIPRIIAAVTGAPYAGRVSAGQDRVDAAGWITIRVVTLDEATPHQEHGEWCGLAHVGADPGSVWILSPNERVCAWGDFDTVLSHELGHALGLWHVRDDDAMMSEFSWAATTFSDRERYHSALAYARGRGKPWDDASLSDPSRSGMDRGVQKIWVVD